MAKPTTQAARNEECEKSDEKAQKGRKKRMKLICIRLLLLFIHPVKVAECVDYILYLFFFFDGSFIGSLRENSSIERYILATVRLVLSFSSWRSLPVFGPSTGAPASHPRATAQQERSDRLDGTGESSSIGVVSRLRWWSPQGDGESDGEN